MDFVIFDQIHPILMYLTLNSKIGQNLVDLIENRLKTIVHILTSSLNWNPISKSDFELDQIQMMKLMESILESTTIRFIGPYRLSLSPTLLEPKNDWQTKGFIK